jgi:hypothetical protein
MHDTRLVFGSWVPDLLCILSNTVALHVVVLLQPLYQNIQ